MEGGRPCDQVRFFEGEGLPAGVGDQGPGRTSDKFTRGEIPGVETDFKVPFGPTRRHITKVERGRTEAPDAHDLAVIQATDGVERQVDVAAAVVIKPRDEDGLGKGGDRGSSDRRIVQKRSLPFDGHKGFVDHGVGDEPHDRTSLVVDGNRCAEVRHVAAVVGGAVYGIDHPKPLARPAVVAAFLAEQIVPWERLGHRGGNHALRFDVGGGDEILRGGLGPDFRSFPQAPQLDLAGPQSGFLGNGGDFV